MVACVRDVARAALLLEPVVKVGPQVGAIAVLGVRCLQPVLTLQDERSVAARQALCARACVRACVCECFGGGGVLCARARHPHRQPTATALRVRRVAVAVQPRNNAMNGLLHACRPAQCVLRSAQRWMPP
jgi:hypothetical protein